MLRSSIQVSRGLDDLEIRPQTREEAVADLRQALDGWFAEFGVREELTVTVPDVA